MIKPPWMTMLKGTGLAAVNAFFASDKTLNSEWITAEGPSAIYVAAHDKTYVVWYQVGLSGHKGVHICYFDHSNGTWSERYRVGHFTGLADDDHGQCSIVRDGDGYFYVFYGSHAGVQRWSVSTSANDITSWTQQTSLTGAQSYPRAVYVGTKLYLFLRNDTDLNQRKLAVRNGTPSGGSVTMSAMVDIVDFGSDSRVYGAECFAVGTDIHFTATLANAADTQRKGVYYFIYDTVTGAVCNHDKQFSVASGSLPVNLTQSNANFRLFDHGSGVGDIPSMCFDSNGSPYVIFADDGASGTTYTLKYITKASSGSPTVWSAPANIDSVFDYIAGGGSITNYCVVPGAAGAVEFWYANNAGDQIRKVLTSSLGAAQTIKSAANSNEPFIGKQAVREADPDFRVIFCETSKSTLDANAIVSARYGYGDSGGVPGSVPMTVDDASWASVQLMLGFPGRDAAVSIINESDSCFAANLIAGNAQIDTAQSKFDGSSLLLDGSGSYITFPDNTVFSVSNGNFTIECFVRRNGSKLQAIASKRVSSGVSEWSCYINASNQVQFQGFSTSALVANVVGTTVLSSGVWYHVAFTRSGTTWRAFLDGALEGSATESATPDGNTTDLHIGRDPSNSGRDFDGWIDEFRFTSGVARYTAAFTAPSARFPRR